MSKENFIILNQFLQYNGLFEHWLSLRDLRNLGGAGICCDKNTAIVLLKDCLPLFSWACRYPVS